MKFPDNSNSMRSRTSMKHVPIASMKKYRFARYFAVLLGLRIVFLLSTSQAAVSVDQKPLTVQASLAPNIVLMLDDSGSMAWNFMPDLCSGSTAYLKGVTCSGGDINTQPNNDALTNSNNNGVYYNPTITYTPPVKADGTSYANSPGLTGAYADGFTNTATTLDITAYALTSTYSSSSYYYTGGTYETEFNNVSSGKSNVAFSTSTAGISATCASGYSVINLGTYASPNYQCSAYGTQTPACSSGTYSSTTGTCVVTPPGPSCGSGYTLTGSGSSTICSGTQTANPTCPSSGTYNTSAGLCTLSPTNCSTTWGSGYALANTGTSSSPNYQCQKTATPTCSSGSYSSSTGTCTVTPPTPTCSTSGTSLSQPTGASAYNCNSTPTCSPGSYTASSGTCAVTPPAPTCPSGTSLSKISGVSTYNCNSTPTCTSSGTYNNVTDTCSKGTRTCPSNTTRGKFSTASIYTCNAAPSCSSGTFTDTSGTCAVTPPAPTCPSGTSLGKFSGATVYTCNAATAPSCSSGSYNASTGTCVVTPPAPSCTSPLALTGSGSSTICSSVKAPACTSSATSAGYSFNSSGGFCGLAPTTCPGGYTGSGSGTSFICSKPVTATPTCSSGSYSSSTGTCVVTPPTPSCSTSGYTLTNTGTSASPNYQCAGYTGGTATCSSGTYNSVTGQCTVSGTPTKYFFQYSTGPAAGPYVNYYVASAAQGCVNVPHSSANCVNENDISGASAPVGVKAGQNIANWFSYYRTRILTAKSGLMNGFSNLDPTIRVGFGSIDGNNTAGLPTSKYSYTDTYNNKTNYIANVQPFGDGSTNTQKAAFWSWVVGESANNGTPLRQALNAVGQYYMTTAPWQNSSSDTTELACRQSYTILTTDGFWNDSSPGVGDVDNTSMTTAITGPNSQQYIYTAAPPYQGSTSDTLADVAMKYWLTDLRTSTLNEVPTSSEDPAFWQHMTTFTLGLGFTPTNISGTTAAGAAVTVPDIFAWSNGGAAITGFSWPAPASNSINNIADLAHAAVNGHGGFYSATSPQAFSSGIADAVKRVATRVGTGASLAANSTKLGTGTVTYQAVYYTGKWTGDLKAYAVDATTGAIATTSTWTASAALPAAASRNIMTYNPSGTTAATKFVAFSDPASLASAQRTALGSNSTIQQSKINYLRGDASGEIRNNGTYRDRSTALGDIINSQPVYVGAPNSNLFYGKSFSGSGDYPTFATGKLTRTPAIWVAANDGMLHAFQASNGVELFAYLPGAVITNGIVNLADPNYGKNSLPHQLFNDGEITVADVYTTLAPSTTAAWRTVLVGTTGRGLAKAIYALDITDPNNPVFLWERSAGDGLANSDYIGQITGQPVITQVADGSWAVVMGNGYNSTQNKAGLLQIDIMNGTLLTVHTTDASTDNGLAAPVVWIGTVSNDIGTIAYAGDLKGKVWSFGLNDGTSSTPSSAGSLLFTTLDSDTSGKAQPITAGMLAGKDPKTGNVWLFFGTGKYLTQSDLSNTDKQTWYGIIVQSSSASLVTNLSTWTGSRTASSSNALVPRSITAQTDATSTKLAARTITIPTAGDMSGKSGWFIDLLKPPSTAQGESMVTPNQFQGSLLLGTSRVPVVTDPCNPSGSGWIMAVDPFTGGNPAALFFDLNNDKKFDSNDQVNSIPAGGVGFGSIANNPIFVSNTMLVSFDNATTSSIDTAGTVGALSRLSWRELVTH